MISPNKPSGQQSFCPHVAGDGKNAYCTLAESGNQALQIERAELISALASMLRQNPLSADDHYGFYESVIIAEALLKRVAPEAL